MANITKELKDFVAANPHIEQVHFTEDGHYHLNAYGDQGNLVSPSRKEQQPGDPITETLSRDEILAEIIDPATAEPKTQTETVTSPGPATAGTETQIAHDGQ